MKTRRTILHLFNKIILLKLSVKKEFNTTFDVTTTGLMLSELRAPSRNLAQALTTFRAEIFFNVFFHRKINICSITRASLVFQRERERERERVFACLAC